MDDAVFDGIKQEGEPFELDKAETAPESSPETVEVEAEPEQGAEVPDETLNAAQEENVPFHKHPRWQKLQDELDELRAFKAEASERLENFNHPAVEETRIPEWFEYLYGPNQEAWTKYSAAHEAEREEIKREAAQEIYRQQHQAQAEMEANIGWVNEQIQELVDDPAVRFDPRYKNELLEIVKRYRPTTEDGAAFDFKAAHDIWKQSRPKASTEAKKRLADRVSSSSGGERASDKGYKTSADLRGSWDKYKNY